MIPVALFGILCVAAIIAAYCARLPAGERDCAIAAAWVLTANWLLFVLPWLYSPLSPAFLLSGAGFAVTHEDMWALADLLSLIVVAHHSRNVWWAPLLWSTYLVTLCMHAVAWSAGLQYLEYRSVLDGSLLLQIAIILTLGGRGIADRVSAAWRSRVLPRLPKLAAYLAGGPR
jgi:hypothetical protein